jgi:D-alanyl-D-alanine carboxypeptidase
MLNAMLNRALVFVFALVLAASSLNAAAAQTAPVLPNTPAGQRMSAWLTAFNSGRRDAIRAYFAKYDPKALKDLDDYVQFSASTGGFDLRKILVSTPTKIVALLQERASDSFAKMMMQVDPKPPHKRVNGFIMPAPRPAEFALPHLSDSELLAQVRAHMQRDAEAGRFSGAVLIAKDGTPVFEQAYGFANREQHIANTVDTRFRIGSMNKMFTATAIMQLVQAGKIDLDKPFGTYITDYPNKSMSSTVTIRQLLTHTGGTGDIFTPEYFKMRAKIHTLQDYIDLFGRRPVLFKPGSKFDYSNYGFVILGRAIELVSGQDYYSFVHDHVFVPAGMNSTGSEPEDIAVPNRAVGYMDTPSGLKPNTDTLPYRASSAGGGYSTAGDLLKFANALQQHKLLNAEYTQMMIAGKVPMGMPDSKYGFGFGDRVINGIECFGHSGGAPGQAGDLDFCPSDGYTVVVLSNFDPPATMHATDFIENRLPLGH